MTTTVWAGSLVKALVRTPSQSQRDFRILIDVLSRPGTVRRLDLPADSPVSAAALVAAGLADVEVTMAVLADEGDPQVPALSAATGAPPVPPQAADVVVALRPPTAPEIRVLRRGDPLYPERGARLIMAVGSLGDPGAELRMRLRGPGIPDESTLGVAGVPVEVLEELASVNAGFPCGIDTFLVAADGLVAGLPRSTRLRIDGGERGDD